MKNNEGGGFLRVGIRFIYVLTTMFIEEKNMDFR